LYDLANIHGMDRVGCEYGSLGAFIVFDGGMKFSLVPKVEGGMDMLYDILNRSIFHFHF